MKKLFFEIDENGISIDGVQIKSSTQPQELYKLFGDKAREELVNDTLWL